MKTLQSLHEHCATSSVAADRPNYLQKILGELPEIQKTAQPGAQRLLCFKLDGLISPTPTLDRILMNIGTQVMQDDLTKLRHFCETQQKSQKSVLMTDINCSTEAQLAISCHSKLKSAILSFNQNVLFFYQTFDFFTSNFEF